MKYYILIFGLACYTMQIGLAEVPPANPPNELLLQHSAKDLLIAAVQQIVNSESGKRYFSKVAPKSIKLNQKKDMDSADGWIIRWNYTNGVIYIRNPNAKAFNVPIADAEDGILFEIFITYKHGGAMVGRIKNFPIAENPKVNIAYDLVTKNKDEKLLHEIDEVCVKIQGQMAPLLGIKQP